MDSAEVLRSEWMAYALTRIQSLVDLPRHVSGCPAPTEVEPELAPGLGRS